MKKKLNTGQLPAKSSLFFGGEVSVTRIDAVALRV
jgi:hypothetical protein